MYILMGHFALQYLAQPLKMMIVADLLFYYKQQVPIVVIVIFIRCVIWKNILTFWSLQNS